ncbi:proteasomal ATPase-associated factor 1-like [Octodon degus]|uniref:Proteasomal ATPase-associated factor 1-like n=1 Tax=Octodon degus TaxID=10160 RepID=A0A6P3VAR7_OCTDE|nr:proteasomal ATPase-associated factor 1-like [Octodon degus]
MSGAVVLRVWSLDQQHQHPSNWLEMPILHYPLDLESDTLRAALSGLQSVAVFGAQDDEPDFKWRRKRSKLANVKEDKKPEDKGKRQKKRETGNDRNGRGGRVEAAPLRIQSDWAQALRKDEGEAWLSCHPPGKPSLYGSLTCQGIGLDGIPEVTASEGFVVNEINKKSIHVSCPKENASSKFLAPYTIFSRIHTKSITCLDISSGGGLGVSSNSDGSMKIWQASNGELRRVLEGHVFDVNCCRFFPSGLVVLSGGMDAQLKIWSAEDATCVATFKGHKGGILDMAIVDRGRNVVSGSRDGTARLWDCGRSACLGVLADCGSSINGVAVGAADNSINLGSPEQMPRITQTSFNGQMDP